MFAWIDAEKAEFTLRNRIAADDTGRRRPWPASLWGQRTRSSLALQSWPKEGMRSPASLLLPLLGTR